MCLSRPASGVQRAVPTVTSCAKANLRSTYHMSTYEPPSESEGELSTGSAVRETDAAIPEQLSRIGREISQTIERSIAEKDEYMLAVKASHDAQGKLGQLVRAGVFGTR